MSGLAKPPMFLSDDVFELLVRRVPPEVLREVPVSHFQEAIGTTKERFSEIVEALGADGRTQGFIGEETANYLRHALGVAILECTEAEFKERTGYDREDAMNVMRQLAARLGTQPAGSGQA